MHWPERTHPRLKYMEKYSVARSVLRDMSSRLLTYMWWYGMATRWIPCDPADRRGMDGRTDGRTDAFAKQVP
jgi:hypothetical protein